ncbi:nucleolar and coiled-body phosphoprotein 1 isoform X2 [Candoia aspera]|uniref:nucleolar and coiled-body phosphoprotein 1 isoform X2 n=1 Tax=Candoia aspera TaxID=51853 RepID=UPI002FD7EC0D
MALARAVPSDLFPLVLAFLRENHFDGAARAFGKAAGLTEQDPNAASLLDIFNYWLKSPVAKKQQAFANGSPAKKTKKESSSSYESSSEDETSPVRKQATKPVTVPPVPIKAAHGSSESSSDDTSDSTDSEQEGKKPTKKGIVLQGKKATIQKRKSQKTSRSSSSDSSSSEDETPKDQPPKSEGAPKGAKLASASAKLTKVMSKTTNGKAEGSSSSDGTSSSEDSSSEEDQPVKSKLKKVPHCRDNAAQPLLVKTKHVKKSDSEDSCDSSEHEKLASKPRRGTYCAVPPPLAIESRKGKAQHLIMKTSKKKREDSKKKEQVSTKRPSTEGSVIKKTFAPKSLPISIQKGDTSSESDSDSSSEEDKKVLVKPSAKVISVNGAAKSAPSKNMTSSSDSSDSDSSDSIPEKSAVRTGIKKVEKLPGVLAKKAESSFEVKKVPKKKNGTKDVKTTPKPSVPIPKPKSSESSSSSSEEEQNQAAQKSASKLSVGSNVIISKQVPANRGTSSDSSSDEQLKISEKRERKRVQNSCRTEKKALKTSSNFVGKTSASKNRISEMLNTAKSGSSDEEATKGGLSKNKRKRKYDQELETPDIKKMKPRSPHTFPKTKQQSSPFRRIRTEEVEVDVRVANNSFDAKELQVTGVKKQIMF